MFGKQLFRLMCDLGWRHDFADQLLQHDFNWTNDEIELVCFIAQLQSRARPHPHFWNIRALDSDPASEFCVELTDKATKFAVPSVLDPEFEAICIVDTLTQRQFPLTIMTKTSMKCTVAPGGASSCQAVEETVKCACQVQTVVPYVQTLLTQEKFEFPEKLKALTSEVSKVNRTQQVISGQLNHYLSTTPLLQQAVTKQESEVHKLEAAILAADQKLQFLEAQLKGAVSEITDLKRVVVFQARKIEAFEIEVAKPQARIHYGKVLAEMTRKNFQLVLADIAQARQEAKVVALNFGAVFVEMKKRGFSRLLEEIAVAKQNAKAAELAKRLQLIQMEAQQAGIDLGNIGVMPVVTPQVVPVTGDISQHLDNIPMAIPITKEQRHHLELWPHLAEYLAPITSLHNDNILHEFLRFSYPPVGATYHALAILVSEGLLVQGIHSRDHNVFCHL